MFAYIATPLSPRDEPPVGQAFGDPVNLTPAPLRARPKRPESHKAPGPLR